jgi:hypothetical protein
MTRGKGSQLLLAMLLTCGCALAATPEPVGPGVFPSTGPRDFTGAYIGGGNDSGNATAATKSDARTVDRGCTADFVPGIGGRFTTHVVSGKDVIVIAHAESRQVRRIHLGGEHPQGLKPSALGHSVGRWEGDTLVVETVGLKSPRTVIERFRKVDGGRQLETTVDGRAMLANWQPDLMWREYECDDAGRSAAGGDTAPVVAPARVSAAVSGVSSKAATAMSFDGVWQIARPVRQLRTSDGRAPPLLPQARKRYDGAGAVAETADHCGPVDEPRAGYEGRPFEIVQNDRVIFMGHARDRVVRLVYMRDRHGESTGAGRSGEWIGRRDGDSLVLDGVGFSDVTQLDAAGTPHSEALHVIQRLSLKDGDKQLEIRTTFEDERVFTHPWTTVHRYHRLPDSAIHADSCAR